MFLSTRLSLNLSKKIFLIKDAYNISSYSVPVDAEIFIYAILALFLYEMKEYRTEACSPCKVNSQSGFCLPPQVSGKKLNWRGHDGHLKSSKNVSMVAPWRRPLCVCEEFEELGAVSWELGAANRVYTQPSFTWFTEHVIKIII